MAGRSHEAELAARCAVVERPLLARRSNSLSNSIFIITLVAYLALATVLLYRSPSHGWGFPMFIFLYPFFFVALFFANTRLVMLVWLGLSLANMAVQYIYLKRQHVQKGAAGVMLASLFLWPVQFAGAINSSQTEKSTKEGKESARKKIGPLPAEIRGTVSYTHYLGTEEGHDAVWLEEFDDLEFMVDSQQLDQIGIAEGRTVSLTVEERDAPSELAASKVLWIVDGRPTEP